MTHVLVCGGWDTGAGYPRTRSLLSALRSRSLHVTECRVPMPVEGADKRRALGAPWRWPGLALRLAGFRRAFLRRFRDALATERPDAVLIPYPGHLVAPWVRAEFGGPVLLDLFLSAHGTAVQDRGMFGAGSLPARMLAALDRRACAAADLTLLDTPQHAVDVAVATGLSVDRFSWVPISDPEAPRRPAAYTAPAAGEPIELLFFGTGVPLHGLPFLIEAIRKVDGVRLTLLGGSPREREQAATLPADRLCLGPTFVPRSELDRYLLRSQVVAGAFGVGPKARAVVPFKVVHALAAGRPVLTGDTPGLRAFLEPGVECEVCDTGGSDAIAQALAALVDEPARLVRLASEARLAYDRCFSRRAVADRLAGALTTLGALRRSQVAAPATPEPEVVHP